MTEKELRTYYNFLRMKYPGRQYDSIREILRCCDVVYPEVEWYVREHAPTHQHHDITTELEFNIKIPHYFYKLGTLIEENFDKSYHDELYQVMYDEASYSLQFFMEENAPKRRYWTAGRSGGYVVVEHGFSVLPHIRNSYGIWDDWNDWTRREKLEHIQYYGIGIHTCISALEELLFWYEFERKLEEEKRWLQSSEYVQDFYENSLLDIYKDWLQADHDKLEQLLAQVS